jgi:DNA-binding SARP family transcriptional activator
VHRLRALLDKTDFFDDTLVVTTKNGYGINPNISLKSDVSEADRLIKLSKKTDITIEQKELYVKQLVLLIDQTFLQYSTELMWTSPIREYYKSTYNASMNFLMQNAYEQEQYNELIEYAQQAIQVDSFYEDHYYYYILGLIKKNKFREAIEYYQELISFFHQELQTTLSPKIKDLYTFVIKQEEKNQINLSGLMNELDEYHSEGSYYCDYEVFKRYYQIAKRLSARNEANYYVALLEIGANYSLQQQSNIMEHMIAAIQTTLRKGDVFTRMNPKQCVILLPCEVSSNVDGIISRVKENYAQKSDVPFANIKVNVEPLSKSKERF